MPKHKQTAFMTWYGEPTTVDQELLPILICLRELGVKTQYSCQGSYKRSAYISAEAFGIFKLVKTIYWLFLRRKYSKDLRTFVKKFKRGFKQFSLAHYKDFGQDEIACIRFDRGNYYSAGHSVEFSWSRVHGARIVVRWPKQETDVMLGLLQNTKAVKE